MTEPMTPERLAEIEADVAVLLAGKCLMCGISDDNLLCVRCSYAVREQGAECPPLPVSPSLMTAADLVAEVRRLRVLVDEREANLAAVQSRFDTYFSHMQCDQAARAEAAEARVRELEAAVQEVARLLKRFTHWSCECPPEVEAWLVKHDTPSQGEAPTDEAQEVSDDK